MKLRNIITNYFKHSDQLLYREKNFNKLEGDILRRIAPSKPKWTFFPIQAFSFLAILLLIIGSYFFIRHSTQPVSAQTVLQNVENRLRKKFAYTEKTVQSCSVNPNDYANEFKNEAGAYEDNPTTRKRIVECQKNKGKLYYSRKVWVDQTNNAIRIDNTLAEWDLFTGGKDKQGRPRMTTTNPVAIKHGDDIYSFYTLPEITNSDGTHPGAYVKKGKEDWENDQLSQQMKAPKEVLTEILAKYKKDKNTKISLQEYKENEKSYYKVLFSALNKNTNAFHLAYEQVFEKDTYLPIKAIYYDDSGKEYSSVTTYENLTNTVDPEVFSIAKPPAGYTFIDGVVNSFDINSYCDTCYFGDYARYRLYPLTLLTKDGQEIDIPGIGGGRIQFPLHIKVYESKERFASEQETNNAADVTFTQLKSVESDDKVEGTLDMFYFLSNAKIGNDKPYSRLKIEAYDAKGKTKQKDILTTAKIVYDSTRLPDQGKLRFQHVFQHVEEKSGVKAATYKWTPNTDTTIEFQKPVLITDPCFGYRSGDFQQTICDVKDADGIKEATVIKQEKSQKGSVMRDWWRTDLIYNNLFVTIQFRTYQYDEKKCGTSSSSRFENETNPDCLQRLISDVEKKQIITEVKKLIRKLDGVWK